MCGTLPDRLGVLQSHQLAKARDLAKTVAKGASVGGYPSILAPLTHGVAPQSLAALKPIVLAEAVCKVNMIHAGRVMFLTIVEEALRTAGTSVVVQDSERNIMTLHLYNYVPAEELPQTILPIGSRIALLEPYLHFPYNDENNPLCMRCDNPQAVHLLSEHRYQQCTLRSDLEWTEGQEVVQLSAAAAAELSQQGDRAFATGRFPEATSLYSQALRTSPPEDHPARAHFLNSRAQCHVSKRRWAAALSDCEETLRLDPTHMQSAYYKALALLMLQRPLEARDAAAAPLLDSMAASGKPKVATDVSTLRADIQRAVLEQESGAYDLQAMLKESEGDVRFESRGCISRRHSDYESPRIRMVEGSKAKGRCMVAEEAIPAGTLLMASKALVFEPGDMNSLDTVPGMEHMEVARIVHRVVQTVLDRPESSAELYTLSGGPDFDDLPLPGYTGAVDVQRIRALLCNNWFGTGENEVSHAIKEQRWMEKSGRLLPPSQREAGYEAWKQDMIQSGPLKTWTGLWIRLSFFNHSCLPNSTYFSVGDFMFMSTTRDVQAGEELTISYVHLTAPYSERKKVLAEWNDGNGFACDCARCDASRRNPEITALESEVHAWRRRVGRLSATMPIHAAIAKTSQLPHARLAALERFPDPEVCGVLLPKLELQAQALIESGNPGEAVPIYQRMLVIGASVYGTSHCNYLRDNLRLTLAAVEADNQSVARESSLAAFKRACLPGWLGLPISVPDFHLLIKAVSEVVPEEQLGYDKCIPYLQGLTAEADAATGHLAIHNSPPCCAYCLEQAPKMIGCVRCGELYCSELHQKAHWEIHRQVCK